MAVARLAVLFFGGCFDHCDGPDAMSASRNVPLRGVADPTRPASAPTAQQSDSPLLFLDGLCADGGSAPLGIKTDRTGPGTVFDDSPEAAEDRSADPHYGATGLGVDGERLPLRRIVRAGLRPVEGAPLTVREKVLLPQRVSNDSTPRPKCVEPAFSHTVNEAPTT